MSHVSAGRWARSAPVAPSYEPWSAQSPTTIPPMDGFAAYVPSVGYRPDEDDHDDFVMVDDKTALPQESLPAGRKRKTFGTRKTESRSFMRGLKNPAGVFKRPNHQPTMAPLPDGFVPNWAMSTTAPTPATFTVPIPTMPTIYSPPQSPSSDHSSGMRHSRQSSGSSVGSVSPKSKVSSGPPNGFRANQLQQQYYGNWTQPVTVMMAAAPTPYLISPILRESQAGFSTFPSAPFSPQRSTLPQAWFARTEPITAPEQAPPSPTPSSPSTMVDSVSSATGSVRSRSHSPPVIPSQPRWTASHSAQPNSPSWGCTLNPLLVHSTAPPVHFDVRRAPSLVTSGAASEPVVPLIDAEHSEPATWPTLTTMTISHLADDGAFPSPNFPVFPWPIIVRNPEGVTCRDVWTHIYACFRVHLTRTEYENLPRSRREQVDITYWQRCRGGNSWESPPPGPDDGCRRIDFMGTRIMFRGLEPSPTGDGTWTLFLGPP